MNSHSFHYTGNSVLEVKRDRLLIGSHEPIFLYTNSDQIGSSMICMAKPASSHSTIEFMPNSHHYESATIAHEAHTNQTLTIISTGGNKT
jgi:hypothetical protein